jgi:hypothetical protein
VTYTTTSSGNTAPTISAIADQKINVNESTATLSFSIADSKTSSSSLSLSKQSSDAALIPLSNIVLGGSGANRTVKVTPAAGKTGSAVITLRVSDGSLSDSEPFTVRVLPYPTITLTSPANGSYYTAPATVTLAASVVTNGNTINSVKFYSGTTLLGQDSSAPYRFTWSGAGAGSYSLKAIVVYNGSKTLSSSTRSITVTNPPPTVSLAASSATLTAPFYRLNGMITQDSDTSVTTGGRAVFTFTVPTSTNFTVTGKVLAPDESANGFFLNMDSEPSDPVCIWEIVPASAVTDRIVTWRGSTGTSSEPQYSPKIFSLAAGTHKLIVRGREGRTRLGDLTLRAVSGLSGAWKVTGVGSTGARGLGRISGGDYTLNGAGVLGGSSDSFLFMYQPLSGDGEIRARITSIEDTGSGARAGVMIRESLTSGSKFAMMSVAPFETFDWRRRETTSGSTASLWSGATPTTWVRLIRRGNSIYGAKSADGVSWTTVSYSSNMAMAPNIWIGLAVASGASGNVNTAVFRNVTVLP